MNEIRYVISCEKTDGNWVEAFEEEDSTLSNCLSNIAEQFIKGKIISINIDRIIVEV